MCNIQRWYQWNERYQSWPNISRKEGLIRCYTVWIDIGMWWYQSYMTVLNLPISVSASVKPVLWQLWWKWLCSIQSSTWLCCGRILVIKLFVIVHLNAPGVTVSWAVQLTEPYSFVAVQRNRPPSSGKASAITSVQISSGGTSRKVTWYREMNLMCNLKWCRFRLPRSWCFN